MPAIAKLARNRLLGAGAGAVSEGATIVEVMTAPDICEALMVGRGPSTGPIFGQNQVKDHKGSRQPLRLRIASIYEGR